MSNAKVRARRRRRGNRAWTAAMSPVELALTPGKPSPSLCEYVEHSCHVLADGSTHPAWQRTGEVRWTSSQPNVQNFPKHGLKNPGQALSAPPDSSA